MTALGLFPGDPRGLPASLPEHVRRGIEADIVTGRMAPGSRVTEEALADRFAVSRTSVREAMRTLEGAGLLERDRGRGVVVAAQTTAEEAQIVYGVRLAVETFLTERAASRVTDGDLARLADLHARFSQVLERGGDDVGELVFLDSQLHWTIYAAAQSDLASVVVSYWGRLQRELAARAYRGAPPAEFGRQHAEILRALGDRDAPAARELMDRHLRESTRAILGSFEAPA